jgi:hypothetical protein
MKPIKERIIMFDELKVKLSTKFMKGIVAKLISKALYKKLGYEINIQLNEIEVQNIDGTVHIHINADGEIDKGNFYKIIKDAGLD